jgi:hypothetical protein
LYHASESETETEIDKSMEIESGMKINEETVTEVKSIT